METAQAVLAAETADAIVGFLYRVHRQDHIARITPKLTYGDNIEFNDYVDGLHESVRIFDEEFQPSKVLFELAPEPYRVYLAEYPPESEAGDEASIQPELPDGTPVAQDVPIAAMADAASTISTTNEQPGADEVSND
jgi:hypothetical protein